jgi:hypothetical protein
LKSSAFGRVNLYPKDATLHSQAVLREAESAQILILHFS